jgi:hypothetical protein
MINIQEVLERECLEALDKRIYGKNQFNLAKMVLSFNWSKNYHFILINKLKIKN